MEKYIFFINFNTHLKRLFMSHLTYLSLQGNKQGLISAGCSSIESIGNRYQVGHENEIQVLLLKHMMNREQHVNHQPIEFIKPIDKSTPLIANAINDNELLQPRFNLYRTNQQGFLENFFEIYLTDATIQQVVLCSPHSLNDPDGVPFEKILLGYKSINWKHKSAGTIAYSIWDDRVY
jgi:type VI secretion system Hcp family effector